MNRGDISRGEISVLELYYCGGLCVNSIVEKCYIELAFPLLSTLKRFFYWWWYWISFNFDIDIVMAFLLRLILKGFSFYLYWNGFLSILVLQGFFHCFWYWKDLLVVINIERFSHCCWYWTVFLLFLVMKWLPIVISVRMVFLLLLSWSVVLICVKKCSELRFNFVRYHWERHIDDKWCGGVCCDILISVG